MRFWIQDFQCGRMTTRLKRNKIQGFMDRRWSNDRFSRWAIRMGHGHEPSAPSVASPVTEHNNNKTTVPQSVITVSISKSIVSVKRNLKLMIQSEYRRLLLLKVHLQMCVWLWIYFKNKDWGLLCNDVLRVMHSILSLKRLEK